MSSITEILPLASPLIRCAVILLLFSPTCLLSVIIPAAWAVFSYECGTWVTFSVYWIHKEHVYSEGAYCTVLAIVAFCVLVGTIPSLHLSAGR